MFDNRGSVILLIMLLLGVVTLVGVGALVMSRYDLKLTSSLKSYDKGFNLADGAATLAFRDLSQRDREQDTALTDPANPPGAITIFCHCQNSSYCTVLTGTSPNTRDTCVRCVDRSVGNFDTQIRIMGYTTQPQEGYEWGTHTAEFWTGIGLATPVKTSAYNAMVETSVSKIKASK
jgi:hypothetical protein